jgi:replicative DNA helicase
MTKHFINQIFNSPEIISKTRVKPEDIELTEHRKVYEAMLSVHRKGGIIDEQLIAKELDCSVSEIFPFHDPLILSSNWRYYEGQIIESSRQRMIKKVAEDIFKSEMPSDELIAKFMESTEKARDRANFQPQQIKDCVLLAIDDLSARVNGTKPKGYPTGINRLDDNIGGLQPRRLIYVGARPSGGKSALLMNMIMSCNVPCLVFSAESASIELVNRMLIRESKLNSRNFQLGVLKSGEMEKIVSVAEKLFNKEIIIHDEPNINIGRLLSIAYDMKRRYDIKAIFIDYIQILGHMSKFQQNRENVADTSKRLKQLARELDLPVICASQLNRDTENKKPTNANHAESDQIGRDADISILIYNKGEIVGDETYLCVEKNRDGKCGDLPVIFEPQYMNFRD